MIGTCIRRASPSLSDHYLNVDWQLLIVICPRKKNRSRRLTKSRTSATRSTRELRRRVLSTSHSPLEKGGNSYINFHGLWSLYLTVAGEKPSAFGLDVPHKGRVYRSLRTETGLSPRALMTRQEMGRTSRTQPTIDLTSKASARLQTHFDRRA